jgi:hypothetical protein
MKKILILSFLLTFYGCAISIGNKVADVADDNNVATNGNSVYHFDGHSMIAFNKISPKKRAAFEMLNKTIIMPAIQRANLSVYNSLTFLSSEEQNEDGTYTFLYIASPYLENEDYDILSILVAVHGRPRAEEYFQLWLDCFAEEQETLLFR